MDEQQEKVIIGGGSIENAFARAGMYYQGQPKRRYAKYSDDFLIESLRGAAKNLGRNPSSSDARRCLVGPSRSVFAVRFGSWDNALLRAGLINSQIAAD